MRKFLLILQLWSTQLCMAGGEYTCIDACASSLGGATLTQLNIYAGVNNIGALAFLEKHAIGISTQRKFMLNELSAHQLIFIQPVNFGVFSYHINYFGYHLYNETNIGISYARKFTKALSMGLGVSYRHTKLVHQKVQPQVIISLGMQSKLSPHFYMGFFLSTPIHSSKKLIEPPKLRIGGSYQQNNLLKLFFEVENSLLYRSFLRLGVEYRVFDQLSLRTGFRTDQFAFSTGIGLFLKNLQIDISLQQHLDLGTTPSTSASYEF